MNPSLTLAGVLLGMDRFCPVPSQPLEAHMSCSSLLPDEEPAQRAHVAVLSHTVVSGKAMPLGRAHLGTWELTLHCWMGLAA